MSFVKEGRKEARKEEKKEERKEGIEGRKETKNKGGTE